MVLRPRHGEIRVVEDVTAAFAELVAAEVTTSASEPFSLVLSGGGTARRAYEQLAAHDSIPWDRVALLIGDERCVPPDDPDANQRLIRESLLDRVGSVAAFHPMDCADADGYDALVRAMEPLDLVHLGLGPDGHTASLFPDSAALDLPAGRLVVTNSDPQGNNPHERLTLTFEALDRARLAVFTVSGPEKHDALHNVLTSATVPAARVHAERVVWLCDPEALGPDLDNVTLP